MVASRGFSEELDSGLVGVGIPAAGFALRGRPGLRLGVVDWSMSLGVWWIPAARQGDVELDSGALALQSLFHLPH